MKREEYTQANREAWNEAQGIHAAGRTNDIVTDIRRGIYAIDESVMHGIDFKDKKIAQLCCNNGREILSLHAMGAGECVGFDIADKFIDEARDMANKLSFKCKFIQTDIFEITDYKEYFDIVLFTVGALPWIDDLDLVFQKASRLLVPGGSVIISDIHPMTNIFSAPGEELFNADCPERLTYNYFRKEPLIDENGMDYIGGTTYKSKKFISFLHTFSDYINAIVKNGMNVQLLDESEVDSACSFEHLQGKGIPLSFRIVAVKK